MIDTYMLRNIQFNESSNADNAIKNPQSTSKELARKQKKIHSSK